MINMAEYILVNEYGIIKAINGNTGNVDYSSRDATNVIQNAINKVNEGDMIHIKPGIYITRKLSLKPINIIGSGKSTILRLANNTNTDMIESYSGGYIDGNREYYRRGKIANLMIDGNKSNNISGNGIVLAWTQDYILENLWLTNIKEHAIKILRSYWTSLRDISISTCTNGIKIGEYDSSGKYNNNSVGDLFSNANNFTNIHVEGPTTIGIQIESGDDNTFINCDTSGCTTGVLLQAVTGVDHVYKTNFIGHWFESNTTGLKIVNGGTTGTRYTYITNPTFGDNVTNIDDTEDSGHYILIDANNISGGLSSPDVTLYRLYVKYGIYKGVGDRIYIKDPISLPGIYNMNIYRGDYGGNFSIFTPPLVKGDGHFFFAEDTNSTNPSKRMYVSFDGSKWNYINFS